jgi:RsiW-degrading membrane proteinase PrsW (M82 family)
MNYIALAIAPGLAIVLFIIYKDRYNKEPKLNLIVSFILGCACIYPAIWLEQTFSYVLDGTLMGVAVFSYFVVALSEEGCKMVALRFYSYRQKSFDEPLDGIVYSVMVSMGFATIENVMYVMKYAELGSGLQIGLQRMFLAVPAHATFAVVMGYFVGKAKFSPVNAKMFMFMGLAGAVFFHGTYDFFLFIKSYSLIAENWSETLLIGGAITSLIVALILSRKLLRTQRNLSAELFKKENTNVSV